MTTYNTGNPLGSVDVRDLYDNAENADKLINGTSPAYPDRLGVSRKSWAGMEADFAAFLLASGYEFIGDYDTDGPLLIERPNQVFTKDGEYWRSGPALALPYTTVNNWVTDAPKFVSVGDAVLRQALADPDGASRVGRGAGTVDTAIDAIESDVSSLQLVVAEYARPQEFGAAGDGLADDTAALLACLSDGRPVYLGGGLDTYRITAEISYSAASAVVILASGASIVVDSISNIRSALRIDLAGNSVSVTGKLTINCAGNSFTGLNITNYGAAVAEAQTTVSGLTVIDCYRDSQAHTGGDGIFIAGRFSSVTVNDVLIDGVRMATGAGVFGVQGVSGITVARDNTNGWDAALINVTNSHVRKVFSEDVSYTADQDGIRVFTSYASAGDKPRPVYADISGCRLYNCMGRAIKVQSEFSTVCNIKIDRDATIYSDYLGNPDIDFQVGGGQVTNVQANYDGNVPSRVVQFTLTQTDTRVNPIACQVKNIIVNQVGVGVGVARFMTVATTFNADSQVSIDSVNINGTKTPDYILTLQSQVTAGLFAVDISGILSRIGIACVQRLGVATPSWITGASIVNQGSSVPFAQATNAGSFTTSLIGANRLVT